MNDTLRDTLMIEVHDLFAKYKVFQKRRSSRIGPKRVLIIGKHEALVGGKRRVISTSNLVQFAAGSKL